MLEYEVQASTLTVFCQVEHPSEEEDTSARQLPMVDVTLIMPLESTTVILLPSHLSTISATLQIQLRSLNAIIKVNKIPPWLLSAKSNTHLRRKTHAPDSHDGHRYPDYASWDNGRDFTSKSLIKYLSYATDSATIDQCYNQG